MPTSRILACFAVLSALVAPAHAATPDRTDALWRPWTELLQRSPYDVPEAAGRLRGIAPLSRCGTAGSPSTASTDPSSDLGTAVARLATAMHVDDALAPGLTLRPETAGYLARLTDCLAAHIPHLPAYDGERLGPAGDGLRAQWLGAMTDLVRLAEQAPDLPASDARAACVDILCLVQTGGTGSDTYTADAALIVDQGGVDTYRNNAGGADVLSQLLPAALLLDLGTDGDNYEPVDTDLYGSPTNGSGGTGGVGVLVDQGGNDHYCGAGGTMGTAFEGGAGLLLDLGGADYYESWDPDTDTTGCPWNAGTVYGNSHKVDHGGAAYGGFGFLVDAAGDDRYLNYGVDSLGWGAAGGTGLLLDASGADTYTVMAARTTCGVGVCDSEVSGVSIGTGEVGGVGVLLDGGSSRDSYGCYEQMSYGCIGASTLGGVLGLVYDAGGNDSYNIPTVIDPGVLGSHRASGIGAAELGGSGIFVDLAGNDTYTSASPAAVGYGDAGIGLFLDLGGTDGYSVPGTPTVGTRTNGGTWVAGVVGLGKDI